VTSADPARSKQITIRAAIGAAAAGFVSSIHHWYGAIAYDTPWRFIVSLWIPGFVLLVLLLLYIYWKSTGKVVRTVTVWAFFLSAVVFQAGFTLFESVYSHVLKNILYFGGASQSLLLRLFPPPAYHLPDNWLFEFTGVLQLVGFVAAWLAYRVVQDQRT